MIGVMALQRKELAGFKFLIDRPKGTIKEWPQDDGGVKRFEYPCDYGYFPGHKGEDDEGLDAFVGDDPDGHFEVFQKLKPSDQGPVLDETKFLVGVSDSEREAIYGLYGPEVHARRTFRGPDQLREALPKFKTVRKARYKMEKDASFFGHATGNVARDTVNSAVGALKEHAPTFQAAIPAAVNTAAEAVAPHLNALKVEAPQFAGDVMRTAVPTAVNSAAEALKPHLEELRGAVPGLAGDAVRAGLHAGADELKHYGGRAYATMVDAARDRRVQGGLGAVAALYGGKKLYDAYQQHKFHTLAGKAYAAQHPENPEAEAYGRMLAERGMKVGHVVDTFAAILRKQADANLSPEERASRFQRYADMVRNEGVYAGTNHKRVVIPKKDLDDHDLKGLGFEQVFLAIPEAGQDRFHSYRHPDNLFHLHSHGDRWTMHEDEHPSSTMLARKIGPVPAFFHGLPHVLTEGVPGLANYLGGVVAGRKSTADVVQQQLEDQKRNKEMGLQPKQAAFAKAARTVIARYKLSDMKAADIDKILGDGAITANKTGPAEQAVIDDRLVRAFKSLDDKGPSQGTESALGQLPMDGTTTT